MRADNRHAFGIRPGMRRGYRSEAPLPTRLVSNEEFPPLPQTAAQRAVEDRILADAGRLAPRLGLTRRAFLRTSGGMAASLLAMNAVFGRFFDVLPVEAADPAAFDAFGTDHVLWGTDSIWYGTPQWQIEAFRRFEIPQALADKHGYAPLTREVKERIFGLNAARVFGVDVSAKRNEIPKDYLSRVKMSYRDEGGAPSHRWYGWVAG